MSLNPGDMGLASQKDPPQMSWFVEYLYVNRIIMFLKFCILCVCVRSQNLAHVLGKFPLLDVTALVPATAPCTAVVTANLPPSSWDFTVRVVRGPVRHTLLFSSITDASTINKYWPPTGNARRNCAMKKSRCGATVWVNTEPPSPTIWNKQMCFGLYFDQSTKPTNLFGGLMECAMTDKSNNVKD